MITEEHIWMRCVVIYLNILNILHIPLIPRIQYSVTPGRNSVLSASKKSIYEGNVLFDNSVFRYTYTHAHICTHVHSSIRACTSSCAAINHLSIGSFQKVFNLVNGLDLYFAVKLMIYNILNASTFL